MHISRRTTVLGLMGSVLSACVSSGGGGSTPRAEVAMRAVPNAGYDAWVANFRDTALSRGVAAGTYDTAFASAGFLPDVIERDRNQTEFTRTTQDYLAIAASDERITKGRAAFARTRSILAQIEDRYGVEAHVIAAVWGLESYFGERRGAVPVISALSTLAFDGRRADFFEQQLVAALKILQNGDTTPGQMTGSWAGAMGHTQFIPTSYQSFAVDFTGDGRRDIWSDDPTDALASTGAYLAKSGWVPGQPWGEEVRLPTGFNTGLAGRGSGRSSADWAGLGVTRADGGALVSHGAASLLLPAGASGPALLIYRNFSVILRYNNAENYAIGVGHLSDRLNGGAALRGTFPPDANGMTIAQRQQMQARLTAAGFDTDGTDGVIGAKTTAAISAYQRSVGLPVTGIPSLDLLARLG